MTDDRNTAFEAGEYEALRQFIRLSEKSEKGSMARKLGAAVDRELTPRQRQMVRMYYTDQMRMQDIADALGVTVSSVSRTIKRGRVKLKRCLRYGGRALMAAMEQ